MPQLANILTTETAHHFQQAVKQAVELLRRGEVVALPTETVYGLAANAMDATAVEKIFELKGRPLQNPIIVHIASMDVARRCVSGWPPLTTKLVRAFWPGPLTVVLPRSKLIPDIVTAGGETVGLRWPSHPFIQAVINECGFPLAAPSANPANRVSPTNAEHVREYFGERIPLIVDGGQCQVGIESTVVDLTTAVPRLLRPGMIHEEALLAVTGELQISSELQDRILKSPGQLKKHYSPRAKLVVRSWKNDADLRGQIREGISLATTHIISHTRIPSADQFPHISIIAHDHEAFARALYAELHRCDQEGAQLIIIEDVPRTSEWQAIADRLKRAASK